MLYDLVHHQVEQNGAEISCRIPILVWTSSASLLFVVGLWSCRIQVFHYFNQVLRFRGRHRF